MKDTVERMKVSNRLGENIYNTYTRKLELEYINNSKIKTTQLKKNSLKDLDTSQKQTYKYPKTSEKVLNIIKIFGGIQIKTTKRSLLIPTTMATMKRLI